MPRPSHLTIPFLAALAVVIAGCGSTNTVTTTKVASAPPGTTPAGTTAPAGTSAPGTSSTTPPTATPTTTTTTTTTTTPTTKAATPKPTKAAPKPQTTSTKAAPLPLIPPPRYLFEPQIKKAFIGYCVPGGGTTAGCECMIDHYEARNVEEGEAIAGLLGIELALKDHIRLARRAKQYAAECRVTLNTGAKPPKT